MSSEDDSTEKPSSPVHDRLTEDEVVPPSRLSITVLDADSLAPIFFTALFLSMFLALSYVLSSFLADAVISFILIGLFSRPYQHILARVKNRWVASGITTTIVAVALLAPLFGFLYALTIESAVAFDRVAYLFEDGGSGLIEKAVELSESGGIHVTREFISEYVGQLATSLNSMVVALGSAVFGNVLAFTLHAAIEIVMIFYLFADGEHLRAFLFRLSPLPDREDALIVETFQKVARGLIVGNGLGSAIQGVLGGLAMWAAGLPSPLLWGAVMTVFAFLPLVGIMIVVFPATFALLMRGETSTAAVFLVFCLVMGTLVENIVKTKLMGSAMRMHDLLVFLSIIGGLGAFGVIGFIYGPLIAMLFITLHGLYESHYLPQIAHTFRGNRVSRPFKHP